MITRLQIVQKDKMVNKLDDQNPITLMAELSTLEDHIELSKINMEEMEKIYSAEQLRTNKMTKVADYNIACCFLRRIPTLTEDEVKQLYIFIVNWM